jgi:4-aminobutyrate aminotransferase
MTNDTTTSYIGPAGVLEKKRSYLVPCSYHFYAEAPQLVRGEMQYLWDSEGKRYLDFYAGVSVMACGHSNPRILEATIRQLRELQHTSTIYLTQPIVDLAERLAGLLPGDIRRSFFCNSGSEANEGAFLLARLHTGRRRVVSLERGLHGRTYLGMSATGLSMWRTDSRLDPTFAVVPGPFDAALRRTSAEAATRSLAAIERELDEDDVAALILEPIQGNGGIVVLPDDYLRALRALTAERGVLLIADEVQTGFGRTGSCFAVEHASVVPDIITMAKALGNGIPIAAYSAPDRIAASFTKPSASTLGGNPVSCATALAVLDYIETEDLIHRAAHLGERLEAGLRDIAARRPHIAAVRGRGLMFGVELVDADGSSDPRSADIVLERAKDAGLFIGKNGPDRNVLAFQPPIVITETDVDQCLSILDAATADLEAT